MSLAAVMVGRQNEIGECLNAVDRSHEKALHLSEADLVEMGVRVKEGSDLPALQIDRYNPAGSSRGF